MVSKRKSSRQKKLQRRRTTSRRRTRATHGERKRKTAHYVYSFGDGHADGAGSMKPLLGGKGANLHEMTRIGLPVPPGFTITTEVGSYCYDHKRTYRSQLEAQLAGALARVQESVGKELGDKEQRLPVSVRSGCRDVMPG